MLLRTTARRYAPRWDTYARIFEYLFANVTTAYVGGNHEVSNGGENWLSYKARYPNQHALSGSDSFLWHSFEAGPAHVVTLCRCGAQGLDLSANLHPATCTFELVTPDRARSFLRLPPPLPASTSLTLPTATRAHMRPFAAMPTSPSRARSTSGWPLTWPRWTGPRHRGCSRCGTRRGTPRTPTTQ